MKTLVARSVGVVAAGALAASLGAVAPAQAAPIPVPAGTDRGPAAAGATYLAAQVQADGIIDSSFGGFTYADVGLTIDAATSLDAVGGQAAFVAQMRDGVAANVNSYTEPGFGTNVSANATAKAGAFAVTLGANPAAFGGTNLVTRLENLVDADGRIADDYDMSNPNAANYATPLGQAYAAQVLYTRSAKADAALTDLKRQQCSGLDKGFFRASFATPVCANDPGAVPSVDTTAFAVLALQSQKGRVVGQADVNEMLNKAVQWLTQQQAADGSFKSTAGAVNANSTGLAGWALGVSGVRPNAAERAANWLRTHQLANAGACVRYADAVNGAVVVDDLGLANANAAPLSADQQSTATRATAQALPGLVYAGGGSAAGDTRLTAPAGFLSAGTSQSLTISGPPSNVLCVTVGAQSTRVVLNDSGSATVPVVLPLTSQNFTVSSVDASGETDSATFKVLAGTKFAVKLRDKRVRSGAKAVVKVSGLVAGEHATATYRGKVVGSGTANANGKLKIRFKTATAGGGKVKVTGQFSDRRGKAGLRVTRRR